MPFRVLLHPELFVSKRDPGNRPAAAIQKPNVAKDSISSLSTDYSSHVNTRDVQRIPSRESIKPSKRGRCRRARPTSASHTDCHQVPSRNVSGAQGLLRHTEALKDHEYLRNDLGGKLNRAGDDEARLCHVSKVEVLVQLGDFKRPSASPCYNTNDVRERSGEILAVSSTSTAGNSCDLPSTGGTSFLDESFLDAAIEDLLKRGSSEGSSEGSTEGSSQGSSKSQPEPTHTQATKTESGHTRTLYRSKKAMPSSSCQEELGALGVEQPKERGEDDCRGQGRTEDPLSTSSLGSSDADQRPQAIPSAARIVNLQGGVCIVKSMGQLPGSLKAVMTQQKLNNEVQSSSSGSAGHNGSGDTRTSGSSSLQTDELLEQVMEMVQAGSLDQLASWSSSLATGETSSGSSCGTSRT